MKLLLLILIIIITAHFPSEAQTIPDNEFSWETTQQCKPLEKNTELFVVVEKAPSIKQYSIEQFELLIKNLILKLHLNDEQNGVLKIKILFTVKQEFCVNSLGFKDITLDKIQQDLIISTLGSIYQFEPGKQRNIEVNCQGILYIYIKKGKLEKIRNVNFTIS